MKRILLFLATNLAILLVVSVVFNIVIAATGIDARGSVGLLIFWLWWCVCLALDISLDGHSVNQSAGN